VPLAGPLLFWGIVVECLDNRIKLLKAGFGVTLTSHKAESEPKPYIRLLADVLI
jgi:hypothetical protein